MKSKILLLLLVPGMLILTGCPIGMKYPLGYPGKEKIDKELIGDWVTNAKEPDFRRVIIKKADDYSYDVDVFETGKWYAPKTNIHKGWVTTLKGKKFVYFKPEGEDDYYLYYYEFKNGQLSTFDVGLKVGGKDAVISTKAFREEVEKSLKRTDCISGEIVWEKNVGEKSSGGRVEK